MSDKVQKKTKKKKRSNSEPTVLPSHARNLGSTGTVATLAPTVEGASSQPQTISLLPDITRSEVQVKQKTEVRDPRTEKGTLNSLLMETGPLDKLIPGEENTWPAVSRRLKDVFLAYQKTLPNEHDKTSPEQYVAMLCTAYYSAKAEPVTKALQDAQYCEGTEVADTVTFLETFMKANGQWDYIEKQDWYKSGDYVIAIDVNYYPDRSGYKVSPIFHKDTGGNNIFVNLVFDNEKPIESTEWFADLEQPSKARTVWQKDLLPDDFLKDLDNSRTTLQDAYPKDKPVSGGVSEGVNTYVSWVDDLVWHATPNNVPRLEYNRKVAELSYAFVDKAAKKPGFQYESVQYKRTMMGVEILGTMAEAKDTKLAKWLAAQGKSSQDLDLALAKRAWQELYSSEREDGREDFVKDAAIREKAGDWRITGAYSEASAPDDRLPGSKSMQETPQTLSTRRRANSLDQQSVEAVRKANEGVERSFLRTWVRVLPKTSDEATTSGLTLT